MKYVTALLAAVVIAVLLTALSAVPPISLFRGWLDGSGLGFVWYGIIAGIIALCLILLNNHARRR